VFFDHLNIDWQYEPQGYVVGGRPYLPDFLLTTSGTWIEVKGSSDQLNPRFMMTAARELPLLKGRGEIGPRLMILGPLPRPTPEGDWGWVGLEYRPDFGYLSEDRYGFSVYAKNGRPWWLGNVDYSPIALLSGADGWLTPLLDRYEPSVEAAYEVARSARFEHGESGPPNPEQRRPFLLPPPIIDETIPRHLMGNQFASDEEMPLLCEALTGTYTNPIVCLCQERHSGDHMSISADEEVHIWSSSAK
jgi:hypothetical protein